MENDKGHPNGQTEHNGASNESTNGDLDNQNNDDIEMEEKIDKENTNDDEDAIGDNDDSDDDSQQHICGICYLVLPDVYTLKRHTFTEHGDSAFICGVCKTMFTDEKDLIRHTETSDVCRTERAAQNAAQISDDTMARVESGFECDRCDKFFDNLADLTAHVLAHENNEEDNEMLEDGEITGQFDYSEIDEDSENETEESETEGNLESIQNEDDNKPHICDVCFLVFANAETLEVHKQGHIAQQLFILQNPLKIPTVPKMPGSTSESKPADQPKSNVQNNEIYRCPTCNKAFVYKSRLELHARTHTGERPHKCDMCDKAFALASNLMSHKVTHTDIKRFSCEICDKTFRTNSQCKSHRRTHSDDRPFSCELCDKFFQTKSSLQSHQRTHTGEKPYKCTVCDRAFRASSHVTVHMRSHSGETPYICDICNRGFQSKSHFILHQKSHIGYKCDLCHKTFKSSAYLKTHVRNHAGQHYKCNKCESTYTTRSNLMQHLLKMHGQIVTREEAQKMSVGQAKMEVIVKEPVLPAIPKLSVLKARLKQAKEEEIFTSSIAIKEEKSDHICDICLVVCEDTDSLQEHKKSHSAQDILNTFDHGALEEESSSESESEEPAVAGDPVMFTEGTFPNIAPVADRPFGCPKCGKTFTKKPYLTAHMLIHEEAPGLVETKKERKMSVNTEYKCEICNKYFSSRSNLNWHIKKHSGTRDFECKVCGKSFAEKGTLMSHERTHTAGRDFKCEICGKTYLHKRNLTGHQRKYKGECKNLPNVQ